MMLPRLLDTGVFSDINFKLGKHHIFKLHSMVLLSKSSWFAHRIKCTTAISKNSFEVFHEDFPSSWLAHFKHPYIRACGDHEAETPCLLEKYLNDLFHFCYLDEYPPRTHGWQKTDSKGLCLSHIFMYMLGLHFGVNSLLERCVDGFTSAITSLDGKEKLIAHFLNIIFELPDLKADDPLLMAAKTQTKNLVRDELGPIHSQFTSQIWDHRFTKAMPKPIKDYLMTELGLDKLDSAEPNLSNLGASTLDAKCARCANTFDIKESKAEPKVCNKCKDSPIQSTYIHLPTASRKTGITLTLWECENCHHLWRSDGMKTRDAPLRNCLVRRLSPDAVKPTKKQRLVWKCMKCRGVWTTFGYAFRTCQPMTECICCS